MLTGDKYDLFRPMCNRPGKKKKKTDRRGSGVWELRACGVVVVVGIPIAGDRGLGGGSVHSGVAGVGAISRLAHPTFPHPHTLSFTYNLPPHISLISLSLPSLFFDHLSLPPLSFPLPPSLRSPMPRRGREDKNLQVALNSRDSDQCIFLLLSGITGNKQADSLWRGSFPAPSRRHPCGAGAGERGGAGPRGRTGRTRK